MEIETGFANTTENMILIKAGTFQMGRPPVAQGPTEETDAYEQSQLNPFPESPVHLVSLKTYYIDRTEVTNNQFRHFIEQVPAWNTINARGKRGKADGNYLWHWDHRHRHASAHKDAPVVYVSWYAAQAYCQFLGKRLPTEAEWEYVARDRSETARPIPYSTLDTQAWFYFNSLQSTQIIKSKSPNSYGIHDLLGNVWEWVHDWYSFHYYQESPLQNPLGPQSGVGKVIRGGGWNNGPQQLSATLREYVKPHYSVNDLGFRCALPASSE